MSVSFPKLLFAGSLLVNAGLLSAQTPVPSAHNELNRSAVQPMSWITYPEESLVVFESRTRERIGPVDLTAGVRSALNEIVAEPPSSLVPGRKNTVRAPRADGPQSIIKYAPLTNVGYEHVLGDRRSIYAGLSVYGLGFGASAIGLKAEYRFYGLIKSSPKQAPEGFWVAPTVLLWRISINDYYVTESAFVAQIGGIAGYQWIFNDKISLEPALGLSLTAVGSDSDSFLGAGALPLFAIRVGYVLK